MGKRKNANSRESVRRKVRRIVYSSSSCSEDESNNPDDQNGDVRLAPTAAIAPPARHNRAASVNGNWAEPSSTAVIEGLDLDEETLQLLGDAPKLEETLGPNIHKDVALRWQGVVANGLPKEVKDKLLKEYVIPGNCDLLVPPILNPEVKVALPETLVRRDTNLKEKQKQTSIALAALAQATQMILMKEPYSKVLKVVSDAGRILCDSHFNETKTRRGFVISATNTELKDTLLETTRDRYLFGENVSEKLKSAKTVQKSGADLRQNRNQKFNKNNFIKPQAATSKNRLNSKPLYQRITSKPDTGKHRQAQPAQKRPWRINSSRSGRSPPRRPARRS